MLSSRYWTMPDIYAPGARADKVADWLEILALREGRALGAAQLRELSSEFRLRDADIDVGRNTIARRHAMLGRAHPFVVGSGLAAVDAAAETPWAAMLLMSSTSPIRATLDIGKAAAHFEQVTAAAMRSLYGAGTESIRFAWPSDEGRPPEFPDAVRWLAARMSVPIGSAYRPPYAKDGGVDVVAWRPFPDGRSGFPVTLVQCTLERDYAHKAADIDVRVWAGWLRLDVDPATALAVPEVVAAGQAWNALAARTVVLDRVRLAALLDGAADDPTLLAVRGWTQGVLEQLRDSQ